jgi:hypothetical protein
VIPDVQDAPSYGCGMYDRSHERIQHPVRRDQMLKLHNRGLILYCESPVKYPTSPSVAFLSVSFEKKSFIPDPEKPALCSVISGPGRTQIFGTTCRSSCFCGKRKANKKHGLNPFKKPFFQKNGNITVFSLGVGTGSTAEFPGRKPPGTSPSERDQERRTIPTRTPL